MNKKYIVGILKQIRREINDATKLVEDKGIKNTLRTANNDLLTLKKEIEK